MSEALELHVAGLSDIGLVREENEDSIRIERPTDPSVLARQGELLVLADGMGGLADGAAASGTTVSMVAEAYYATEHSTLGAALEAAVKAANAAVYRLSQESGEGHPMGSTVTALAILGSEACVAQVGDSRAYCFRGGILHQVTRDHSLVRELVDMGHMEAGSPHYALHRNVLTRGLGLMPDVAVDLYDIRDLKPGDRLLLTSDGLHELVREEEVVASLEKHGNDLEQACAQLVKIARDRGGPDNISLILACFTGPGGALEVPAGAAASGAPAPARVAPAARVGWLIPLTFFVSFLSGVGLSILVQDRPLLSQADLLRLRVELQAVSERIEALPGDDSTRLELEARLRSVRKLLGE